MLTPKRQPRSPGEPKGSPIPPPTLTVTSERKNLKEDDKKKIQALVNRAILYDQALHLEAQLSVAVAEAQEAQQALVRIAELRSTADRSLSQLQQSMAEIFVAFDQALRTFTQQAERHGIDAAAKALSHHPDAFGALRTTTETRFAGLIQNISDREARAQAPQAAEQARAAWSARASTAAIDQKQALRAYQTATEKVQTIRSQITSTHGHSEGIARSMSDDLRSLSRDAVDDLMQRTGWSREKIEELREPGKQIGSASSHERS